MKVLFKCKTTTVLSLLIFLVLAIMITGRKYTEEKSTYGNTANATEGAVTYLNDLDLSIYTPKNYKRYFLDSKVNWATAEMKRVGMSLLGVSEQIDRAYELYELTEETFDGHEGGDFSYGSLNENSLAELADERIHAMDSLEYQIDDNVEYTDFDIDNKVGVKATYTRKDPFGHEYDAVVDYFFVRDSNIMEIRVYTMEADEANLTKSLAELENEFDSLALLTRDGKVKEMKEENGGFLMELISFNFSPWISLVPFIFILLCGLSFAGKEKDEWNEEALSFGESKQILGFAAILIVFHHLVQQVGPAQAGLLSVLEDVGVCLVGLFFFFSAYGLYESFSKKENYLKGFLKNRYLTILIPFYVTILIFVGGALATSYMVSVPTLISYITGWILINTHMWYVVEIAFLYLAFFLAFRFVKNENLAIGLIAGFVLFMTAGALLLGHGKYWFQGEWWYNTSFLFVVGLLWAKYKPKIMSIIKKRYMIVLAITGIVFALLFVATKYMLTTYSYWSETATNPGYLDKLRCLIVQEPMVLAFVIFAVLISMKVKIGNRVLKFFGEISLELYLIHNLFLANLRIIKGTGLYFACVICTSMIAAWILHELNRFLICKATKKKYQMIRFPAPKDIIKRIKSGLLNARKRMITNLRYAKRNKKKMCVLMVRYIVCILLVIVAILPIYVLMINATKTGFTLARGISFLPEGHFIENILDISSYMEATDGSIYKSVFNSCFIAILNSFLAVYFGSLCAYGFECYQFKGKNILWGILVGTLMMAPTASMIGFSQMIHKLHLTNNFMVLIVMGMATPSVVYFMRMYLRTVRMNEIIEAARIDGCKEFMIFNRIILPVMKPAFVLQIMLAFAMNWNNTIYQSVVIVDAKIKTLSLYLKGLTGNPGNSTNPIVYALLLVTLIPPFVVYIFCSPSIMSQIMLGSVKE